jgi:hypothetical protein
MKLLRIAAPFILLLSAVTTFGQQATGKQPTLLCRFDSLPPMIQHHLREEYGSWKPETSARVLASGVSVRFWFWPVLSGSDRLDRSSDFQV